MSVPSSTRVRFSRLLRPAVALPSCMVLLAFLAVSCSNRMGVSIVAVRPSLTDLEIKTFDSPHYAYINRDIIVKHEPGLAADRHQLLLWLSGTGGDGSGATAFCVLAANEGYHVVSLTYPSSIPAARCRYDADPAAFEKFRMAIIRGGETEHISIGRPECIENRLVKLLLYLQTQRPCEDWSRFLLPEKGIRWESVAVAGQSQGGGHAALLGYKHRVARVICTGAPKDYSSRLDAPAAWYGGEPATPINRFFAFNHRQDPIGCTPEQLLRNLKAMKMDSSGPPADPAVEAPPYSHTRVLLTGYPPVIFTQRNPGKAAKKAHVSVIANEMVDRWHDAWTYMLTETVK